ncbi:hypothetical protein MKEN_00934400 [Mycena kentingensis (nom. inval.)]|nr:hypothetical protein MKEN_00934400 [Mycena kentingensis (nom. inval.)]
MASVDIDDSITCARDIPSAQNFIDNTPVTKTIVLRRIDKALNRVGRAIVRVVASHGHDLHTIANVFGISVGPVRQAIVNGYKDKDDVSRDGDFLPADYKALFPVPVVARGAATHGGVQGSKVVESSTAASSSNGDGKKSARLSPQTVKVETDDESKLESSLSPVDTTPLTYASPFVPSHLPAAASDWVQYGQHMSQPFVFNMNPLQPSSSTQHYQYVFVPHPAPQPKSRKRKLEATAEAERSDVKIRKTKENALTPPMPPTTNQPPSDLPAPPDPIYPPRAMFTPNPLSGSSFPQLPIEVHPHNPLYIALKTPPPSLAPFLHLRTTNPAVDLARHAPLLESQGFSIPTLHILAGWNPHARMHAFSRTLLARVDPAELLAPKPPGAGLTLAEVVELDRIVMSLSLPLDGHGSGTWKRAQHPPYLQTLASFGRTTHTHTLAAFLQNVVGFDLSAHHAFLLRGFDIVNLCDYARTPGGKLDFAPMVLRRKGKAQLGLKAIEVIALEFAVLGLGP